MYNLTDLDFAIDCVEEIHMKNFTRKRYLILKHGFSKVEKLILKARITPASFSWIPKYDYFAENINEIKEVINSVPQKDIFTTVKVTKDCDDQFIRIFDGKKIHENNYEWISESNESKVIKLKFMGNQ